MNIKSEARLRGCANLCRRWFSCTPASALRLRRRTRKTAEAHTIYCHCAMIRSHAASTLRDNRAASACTVIAIWAGTSSACSMRAAYRAKYDDTQREKRSVFVARVQSHEHGTLEVAVDVDFALAAFGALVAAGVRLHQVGSMPFTL